MQLDQLPQHGLFIQTVHDGFDVAFGFGCGIHLLQPLLDRERLHSRDVGRSPLHANLPDDAQVGADRRIAQLSLGVAPITRTALLDFEQLLLLDETIQNGLFLRFGEPRQATSK